MAPEALRRWAESADVVLAADAGADRLLEAGARPAVVIGDMDSISETGAGSGAEVVHAPDQNSTDCDKLLALAASRGYGEVTLTCIEGDALDHVLATLYSAVRGEPGVRFALRTGLAWLVKAQAQTGPAEVTIETAVGRRVSLIPLLPCKGVDIGGVQWTLQGAELSPSGLVGVSNVATGSTVRAAIGEGAALLVAEIPAEEMPQW